MNEENEQKTGKKRGLVIALGCIALIVCVALAVLAVYGGGNPINGIRRLQSRFYRAGEDEIQDALARLAERNPEAEAFVEAYRGVEPLDLTLDLSGELTKGEIPYYTQWDERWGYCRYGEGLIGYTGCGPTALSLVLMGLTGDGTKTPAFVADYAVRNGYCVVGNGTAWTLFSEGAKDLGLTAKELPLWEATMKKELDAGHPIICIMGPGHFTESGHYIVLTGYTEEGFTVLDPNRPSNSETAFAYADIEGEIRNLWSYSV